MSHQYKCIRKDCGKIFESIYKNRKYCSLSCGTIDSNCKRKGYHDIRLVCDNCGKNFKIQKCEYDKHLKKGLKKFFCSKNVWVYFSEEQKDLILLKVYQELIQKEG
jgi:hypothetical protein